ncbi:hypothetical protein VTL71DRAFT_10847 [Oculimacula yallundae]|uniref:Uncharacterized protein n=1 Tax=Oculimacula yallundae TaxID=86028 RepID=A0ABR4CVN2_9HELO
MADLQKPADASSTETVSQTQNVESQQKTKSRYSIRNSWAIFSESEKRNIKIYVGGIMLYKFAIEAFQGSIIALATGRYDREAILAGQAARTCQRVGLLAGLNQACQSLGSFLVTPLLRKNDTKTVLSGAAITFAVLTAILLIVDAATGGKLKPAGWEETHGFEDLGYYGTYNTDAMIPFFCFTGVAYGMVEQIRRVIPKDIVGGDVQKLLRMDSIVHIFYEVSGTIGSLVTSLVLIPYLGNNMSFIISPILLAAAAVVWRFIVAPPRVEKVARVQCTDRKRNIFQKISDEIVEDVVLFFKSIALGLKILFSSRQFVWLIPGYSVSLYTHRFSENNLAVIIAQRYLGNAAWSQIIVAGSNSGELAGALFVFLFGDLVPTPLLWIRLDSLMLSIVWFLVRWYPSYRKMSQAWVVAGAIAPLSFGWAAGDVSLVAWIQSQLESEGEGSGSDEDGINRLSAVMSCLYSIYIVLYAILSPLLGMYVDSVFKRMNDVHEAVKYIGGVQFSVIAGVILLATFVPRGSFAFNPKKLNGNVKVVVDGEAQDSKDLELQTPGTETETPASMQDQAENESTTK